MPELPLPPGQVPKEQQRFPSVITTKDCPCCLGTGCTLTPQGNCMVGNTPAGCCAVPIPAVLCVAIPTKDADSTFTVTTGDNKVFAFFNIDCCYHIQGSGGSIFDLVDCGSGCFFILNIGTPEITVCCQAGRWVLRVPYVMDGQSLVLIKDPVTFNCTPVGGIHLDEILTFKRIDDVECWTMRFQLVMATGVNCNQCVAIAEKTKC